MTNNDYKSFFDDAPIALLRTNIDTGRFLMANKFAATLFGCNSVEELLQKSSNDFYSSTIHNRLVKKLKKNGILQNQEIQMKIKNGEIIWTKASMRINCGGTCVEWFVFDITELVDLRERELIKMKSLSEKIDIRMASLA